MLWLKKFVKIQRWSDLLQNLIINPLWIGWVIQTRGSVIWLTVTYKKNIQIEPLSADYVSWDKERRIRKGGGGGFTKDAVAHCTRVHTEQFSLY